MGRDLGWVEPGMGRCRKRVNQADAFVSPDRATDILTTQTRRSASNFVTTTMTDLITLSPNLILAYTAYVIGTASPGPSNMAIMSVAMNAGRASALTLAAGVVMGSLTWGWLAAFGLATVLATWSHALIVLKVIGGLYLLWLAFKAARSALRKGDIPVQSGALAASSRAALFTRGAAMHLTNPKAIFVWLSIVSMALPAGAAPGQALPIVIGCNILGVCVFGGYAILFSTPLARRIYRAIRRGFEGTVAVFFSYAGLKMLFSKLS